VSKTPHDTDNTYYTRRKLLRYLLCEPNYVLPNIFNPLLARPTRFILPPQPNAFIQQFNSDKATFFIILGLLKQYEISASGSTFSIAPEASTWPRSIALFGSIAETNTVLMDSTDGALKFITVPEDAMISPEDYGPLRQMKFESNLECMEYGMTFLCQ
jgi:hypothetical protein